MLDEKQLAAARVAVERVKDARRRNVAGDEFIRLSREALAALQARPEGRQAK